MMKDEKSTKRQIAKMRSRYGKKNGVIPWMYFDHPSWEDDNNKNHYIRTREKRRWKKENPFKE